MADNLDDLFGDLVSLLQAGGFELVAMLELDGGDLIDHESYHAILVGLEGEVVHEFEVAPDKWRDGAPPQFVKMAVARKAKDYLKASKEDRPFFNTLEFELRERCRSGCCAWYYRTTPLWGG